MKQAQQNITSLIAELDAAQDESSKVSASSKLLIEVFKALVLEGLEQEAFEAMADLSKSEKAINKVLKKYREDLRSWALDTVDLLDPEFDTRPN